MARKIKAGAGYVVLLEPGESTEQCGLRDIIIMRAREWFVLHLNGNYEIAELSRYLTEEEAIDKAVEAAEFLEDTYSKVRRPQTS
jgi:hypothetical protein